MQRALQSAHGNHRRGDQHRANCDLRAQQYVAERHAPSNPAERSGLYDFVGVGAKHLPYRHGSEQNSTRERQQQSYCINIRVRRHFEMDGIFGEWLPQTQSADHFYAAE